MTSQECWLALTLAAGPAGLRWLRSAVQEFGSPEAVLGAGAEALATRGGLPVELANRLASASESPAFRIELRLLAEHSIRLVAWSDPEYPLPLRELASAPLVLYVKGAWPQASPATAPASPRAGQSSPAAETGPAPALAVVGTRRPSRYGESATRTLIANLARAEPRLVVISGLARGIDGIAHEAALDAGLTTWAVMAGGLRRIYPPEHESLAQRVQGQGALLTEFPMTAAPLARNFPVRNRIIAALARAVLIVEAGEQSGSLITAGCAQTYGRTLLALPGNIDQPESVGGNRLIQSGQARLVLDASDVLAGLTGRPPQPLVKGPRPPARKLLRRPRRTPGPGIAQGHLPSPPQAASAPPAQGAPEVATRALPAPLPDGPPGRLLGALRDGPRHPDDLAQAAGLAIEQTLGLLLELELSGEIVQTSEHTFALP